MPKLRRWSFWLGWVGFLGYVPEFPPALRLFHLFFLVPLILPLIKGFTNRDRAAQPVAPFNLPLPPAARGKTLFFIRYTWSSVLVIVSPRMWGQIARQARGDAAATARAIDNPHSYEQKARYRLPFAGEWWVYNGGITAQTSHSWDIVAQRYAYDFVIADDVGRRWRTDGATLTDYRCYGAPIFAASDGEIVEVIDGVRDAPGVGTGWIDPFTPHFPGCMVVIRHAESEYGVYAHLQPGSIAVKVGERVAAGEIIGRCGNSGHSSEPHLHFHLQDQADFWSGAGLPIAFNDLKIDGAPFTSAYLQRGQRVQHTD